MADTVRMVSRRMVRPSSYGGAMPMPALEDVHLTPLDLNCISPAYLIEIGILLPKPPAGGQGLVDTLASSLARALGRHYHFAGRLAIEEHGEDGTVTVPLCCTGEGAELFHAVAPRVAVADVVGSVQTPSSLVRAFFPSWNGVYGGAEDGVAVGSSLTVLWAQVTELSDGVFIGMSMNHAVGDGACFWELFNSWSAINRGDDDGSAAPAAPVHQRWFVDPSHVKIPLPFSTLQAVFRSFDIPPVREGFFTFSTSSIKKLKAKANQEVLMLKAKANDESATSTSISSLQALTAYLWRAVTRARCLPAGQVTPCAMVIGLRGRVRCITPGYVGNAVTVALTTGCTAGDILDKGLGWTAWQVNRAVASFREEDLREWLHRWARDPTFLSPSASHGAGVPGLLMGGSPRFDVFSNDFGWGKPLGVRKTSRSKTDGLAWAFPGPDGEEGSISLQVCLSPQTMERLMADHQFMEAVEVPLA